MIGVPDIPLIAVGSVPFGGISLPYADRRCRFCSPTTHGMIRGNVGWYVPRPVSGLWATRRGVRRCDRC